MRFLKDLRDLLPIVLDYIHQNNILLLKNAILSDKLTLYLKRQEEFNRDYKSIVKNNHIISLFELNKQPILHRLRYICHMGHLNLIHLLIGTDYCANDWNNGLWGAAKNGSKRLVDLMIKCGAIDWDNGLWGACAYGNYRKIYDKKS
jgi:hypothetical protein